MGNLYSVLAYEVISFLWCVLRVRQIFLPAVFFCVWEHPHDIDISFLYSVLRFSSQLSFLCLHTTPRTDPDNSRLTVTAYSILHFSHSSPLTSLWFTHQVRPQLSLWHTSEQCYLSPPVCLTPASVLRFKTEHCSTSQQRFLAPSISVLLSKRPFSYLKLQVVIQQTTPTNSAN